MNIWIIDDNKSSANYIKYIIESIQHEYAEPFNINVFYDVKSMLKADGLDKIDICFVDVVLQTEHDGLFVARQIKQLNYHTLLIFISAYDDYYKDLVQVEPFRFLHKPFDEPDVINVFREAYARISGDDSYVKNRNCLYKYTYNGITFYADLNHIKYICSFKRKIFMYEEIHNDIFQFYGKLDNVESEIDNISDNFVRVNKSYLVNKSFVQSYNKTQIVIDNQLITISPKYRDMVLNKLS